MMCIRATSAMSLVLRFLEFTMEPDVFIAVIGGLNKVLVIFLIFGV
jgi:hypothetical protein